ncbi:MAG: glycosyltransferase family 2 protein [Pseudomonadota bacterium]
MKVSIIIPTLNAEFFLKQLLLSLNNQTLKPLEIIIIDSESDDNTVQIAKDLACKVIQILRKDFNHGKTRNLAAKSAKGDIISFITQDALPENIEYLQNLVQNIGKNNVAVSYGKQVAKKDASEIEKFYRSFNYPDKALIKDKTMIPQLGVKTFFLSNVCSAYEKNIFWELGGFPENTPTNEDMFFTFKAIMKDKKISYEPKARAIHSHPFSLKETYNRYYKIGIFFKKYPEINKYSSNEKEGKKLLFNLLKHLISKFRFHLIPLAMIEIFVKYYSYKKGYARN